jgi:hypothetical protein
MKSTHTCAIVFSLFTFIATGCSTTEGFLGVDCCSDIPAGAIPEPAGNKVCRWQTAMAASALPDQTTLYKSDFIGKTADLSPQALERVSRITSAGSVAQASWVLEPSGDDGLDQTRVQTVANQLAGMGASDLNVTIATPAALGLYGRQAERAAAGFSGNRANNRSRNSRNNSGFGNSGGFGNGGGLF